MKEEATAYIGEERSRLLETFTEKDWEGYKKLNLDLSKSYFVRGSKSNLEKFEAYYLMKCVYTKPLFAKYLLSEYAIRNGGVVYTPDSDDDLSFAEKDLLFLDVHEHLLGMGNSEAHVFTVALNKITNRARCGFRTIILSERKIDIFYYSPELVNISLGGSIESRDPSAERAQQQGSVKSEEAPRSEQNITSVNSGYDRRE